MVVGELAEQVDLLVIGGGPGGYTAALRAAELGREVTLVERGGAAALGGACLHEGCIPSKALIELASTLHRARSHPGLVVDARVDLARFRAATRESIERLASGVASLLERAGVRVIQGEARFSRAERIAVRTPEDQVRFFEFAHAILATGSRPRAPDGLPFDGERILSTADALALEALPDAMTVAGAGDVGVELATAFAKLGVRVTLAGALLEDFDERLVRPVARRLDELGVELESAVPDAFDVLVTTARQPNTDGFPVAGPDGYVPVGADRRATPTVAAIGDIVAGPALAHRAIADAAVAVDALCGRAPELDAPLVPRVVFSDPEIASVGLTEAAAKAAGLDARAHAVPLASSGRAATLREREGHVRVVIDRATDRVVGVHVVAQHASELAGEGALAIEMVASPTDLAAVIHPHPTLSEGLGATA